MDTENENAELSISELAEQLTLREEAAQQEQQSDTALPSEPEAAAVPQPVTAESEAAEGEPAALAAQDAEQPEATAPAPAAETPATQAAEVEPQIDPAELQKVREVADRANQFNQALVEAGVIVGRAQAKLQNDFPDIRSMGDLLELGSSGSDRFDPQRYNNYLIARKELEFAQNMHSQVHAATQQHMGKLSEQLSRVESAKLGQLIPELNDPQKGPALAQSIMDYAKQQGIPAADLHNLPAVGFKVLYRAMTGDTKTPLPKVQAAPATASPAKPAAAKPAAQRPSRLQELESKFERSGKPDDLAALLEARGTL